MYIYKQEFYRNKPLISILFNKSDKWSKNKLSLTDTHTLLLILTGLYTGVGGSLQ
jgi:hypothetical protein